MKNIAVICCIYNNYRVAKEAVEEAADRSTCLKQFILVDNHGPDPDLRPWINSLAIGECLPSGIPQKVDHITVLDAGENLGCHRGFNHGFANLLPEIEYVVKLDDDTFVRTDCWDEIMRAGMAVKNIAFLSADIDPEAKQKNKYIETTIDGMKFEIAPADAIVGFSCVMFRRADLSKWGPMRGAHEQPDDKGLYGGEEAYFANLARTQGLSLAHFPSVYCDHAKNHDRHPDYPMWKWVYGYRRWTNLAMDKWLEDPVAVLSHYRRRMMEEIRSDPINLEFVEYIVARIGQRGNAMDSKRLLELAQTPKIAAIVKLHDLFVKTSGAIDQRA